MGARSQVSEDTQENISENVQILGRGLPQCGLRQRVCIGFLGESENRGPLFRVLGTPTRGGWGRGRAKEVEGRRLEVSKPWWYDGAVELGEGGYHSLDMRCPPQSSCVNAGIFTGEMIGL